LVRAGEAIDYAGTKAAHAKDPRMTKENADQQSCTVCGKIFPQRELTAGAFVRDAIADLIRRDIPGWSADAFICRADLTRYRGQYVRSILASEKREVTALDEQVLHSLQEHDILVTGLDADFVKDRTFGERCADRLASFGGSWTFMACFGAMMFLWITANSLVLLWRPVDPFPYILLNLILSCLAAIQAPIIMMSQNRQEAKDRVRSQHDYQINLKAELEIRHLHEKMDHLLAHQWERLVEIQEIQLELLAEIGRSR